MASLAFNFHIYKWKKCSKYKISFSSNILWLKKKKVKILFSQNLTDVTYIGRELLCFKSFKPNNDLCILVLVFQKLCEGIFKILAKDIPTTCQVSCLEVLRILSRDKKILVPVTTKENMQILLRLAKLNESDDSLEKVSEFPVIVESLKCLCNIVFNSQMAQQLSLELNLAAKLCNLLRKCKDRKFINDIKCFDLRLLFLLSLLHTDIRSQLRYELQGLPLLTQILESAFSIKWTDEYESAIDHNGPPLSPQETDCAIEALKALFNVTVDSWKVHKEVRLRRMFLSTCNLIGLGHP